MRKFFLGSLLFLAVLMPISAQDGKAPPVEAAASKVDGLELPPDQNVGLDEGFVNIQAKCKGEVKWLVISASKIKYITLPQNTIIVSVPPQAGLSINVFAVGVVDGKLTEFARTTITTTGSGPGPGPGPGPTPVTGPLHVTFVVDLNNVTPELAVVLNSQTLRQSITSKGNFFRLYDLKSPVVAQKKLDSVVQRVGGSAVMVIQRNDGHVLVAQAIPRTEAEVITVINQAGGK